MVDSRRCDSSKPTFSRAEPFFEWPIFAVGGLKKGASTGQQRAACCVVRRSTCSCSAGPLTRMLGAGFARHRPESHPAATKRLKAASYRLTRCGSTLRSRDGRECFKCFKVCAKRQKMWVLSLPVALRSLQLGRACDDCWLAWPWPMAACSRAKLKISRHGE